MEEVEFEDSFARDFLLALVIDHDVLTAFDAHWLPQQPFFEDAEMQLVAGWCFEHFREHGEPAGNDIRAHLNFWKSNVEGSPEFRELVTNLVESLLQHARVAQRYAPETLVKKAEQHIRIVREADVVKRVKQAHRKGKPADNELANYEPFKVEGDVSVPLFNPGDPRWVKMVDEILTGTETLISFRDENLNTFFGRSLYRGAFVSLLAPEKRGKTFHLLNFAYEAAFNNRRRTLFVSAGDMDGKQLTDRLYARLANRPHRAKVIKYPSKLAVEWHSDDKKLPTPIDEWEQIEFSESVNREQMEKLIRAKARKFMKDGEELLHLDVYGNNTLTVPMLAASLERRRRIGMPIDVVVLDYADLLVPTTRYNDFRHQQNEIWKDLRRLSTEQEILLITATQASADSYDGSRLGRKHFSEDKRKLAHVTGLVGISPLDKELSASMGMLNWIVNRDMDTRVVSEVVFAGCLDICRPLVLTAIQERGQQDERHAG